jgi:hypothetical protein
METTHLSYTRPTAFHERPKLTRLTSADFCKAKYSHKDQRCYTARLLDLFLNEEKPYVAAYKEFRLATMDYLYANHNDDHASTGEERALCFNTVAETLGYNLDDEGKIKLDYSKISMSDLCEIADELDSREYHRFSERGSEDENTARMELIEIIEACSDYLCDLELTPIKDEWKK